jgi:hypothetical protein
VRSSDTAVASSLLGGQVPQDDLALAQGLRKHGLGRWKEILDDELLVFSCGVDERLKAKGKGGKPKKEIREST